MALTFFSPHRHICNDSTFHPISPHSILFSKELVMSSFPILVLMLYLLASCNSNGMSSVARQTQIKRFQVQQPQTASRSPPTQYRPPQCYTAKCRKTFSPTPDNAYGQPGKFCPYALLLSSPSFPIKNPCLWINLRLYFFPQTGCRSNFSDSCTLQASSNLLRPFR